MNVDDICKNLILNEGFNDELFEEFSKALLGDDIKDFQDPNLRKLMSVAANLPFEERVQELISKFAEKMMDKGAEIPCMSSCTDDCVFHSLEFGSKEGNT